MTTRVLFDVSRLMSRIERGSPTGVDRVCLAYAERLSDHPGVEMIPVRGRKDRLVGVDPAWFERKMRTLRARWSGGEADRPETERQRRLFAALLFVTVGGGTIALVGLGQFSGDVDPLRASKFMPDATARASTVVATIADKWC